ncbi:helix-turn-helix domain-containing protein [Pseudonocardia kunmingensis]|uniref:AraC family transcriptional regulator n=1 Tax=Pseudonocardia kunmingensis TaxID=630975 RepID=A0A543C1Y3_9PSEU|nr:helix-turn-helix domain-containing protein [Pseudonocardia kunmingensis]TQL91084.1 AraC family transcriptional regulator [Pseudonocardia kunmingensis]
MSRASGVDHNPPELKCWQGRGFAMSSAHRHDDVEVNLVEREPLTYLFGGTLVTVEPGQAALFWASVPHRLIDTPQNWDAHVRWLHVPLARVLAWGLPEQAVGELLRGTPLITRQPEYPDSAAFARWSQDLGSDAPDVNAIALLEIQAGVRRLLRSALPQADAAEAGGSRRPEVTDAVRHVVAMARFITEHYREPIQAADVAAAAHLHPNYAMTVFREVLGTTIHTYLTDRRIAEAQRLLLTGTATTSEIAESSGFGSHSGFYAAFAQACGVPPGAYRRTHRTVAPPAR